MNRFISLLTVFTLLWLTAPAQETDVPSTGVFAPATFSPTDNRVIVLPVGGLAKSGEINLPVYYFEDFSNGLEGLQGAWTTSGSQGHLWFKTFPGELPGGYNPLAPIPGGLYGNFLANYFGTN